MKVLLLGLLIVVGLAAYAIGSSKSSQDVVLCAAKKSGALSLASSHGKCAKGEKKLTIAKQGPIGPTGAPGEKGEPGAKGDTGSSALQAPEGVHYVTSPGSSACQSNPGSFCKPTNLSGEFQNFVDIVGGNAEKVGYYKDPSGRVHLSGTTAWFTSGGSSGGFVPEGPFYLPNGYRPPHTLYFEVPSRSDYNNQELPESRSVQIRSDGLVYAPGSFDAFSLDGISFRAG